MEQAASPRSLTAYQAAVASLPFGKALPTAVYLVDDPAFPVPETLRTLANRLREGRALIGGKVSKVTMNMILTANVLKKVPGLELDEEKARVEKAHLRKGKA